MIVQRAFLLVVTLAAAVARPALGQDAVRPAGTAGGTTQGTVSVPDFSGIWSHPSFPGFEPPASGPGPVTNRSRRNGVSNYNQLVGDYTNPILQPWAAEVVKKHGEISLKGITYPNPANQCWPEPVPFLFKHMAMQLLQQPDKITMLFNENHEVRWVRLNEPHPAQVKPSWHGDAVAHYEGDTLVIDTVGVKTDQPYGMIDLFGTPYTDKLHVVERYRLVDYDVAKGDLERGAKENWRPGGPANTSNYNDKYLQVHFTIQDDGAFTTPWTATMIYLRDRGEWPEVDCAENRFGFEHEADVPKAGKPDF